MLSREICLNCKNSVGLKVDSYEVTHGWLCAIRAEPKEFFKNKDAEPSTNCPNKFQHAVALGIEND